jgi:hypothetical protein
LTVIYKTPELKEQLFDYVERNVGNIVNSTLGDLEQTDGAFTASIGVDTGMYECVVHAINNLNQTEQCIIAMFNNSYRLLEGNLAQVENWMTD